MYRQRLQLIRTAWHHLSSYQSLVFGMHRQRRSSNALLGTISSAIKAWVLACIANACSSYALLGTTSSAITAWFRARIANACSSATHTHSSAPPPQLSPRLPSFELLRTVVRLTCRFWLLKTFALFSNCNFKLHICAI
jgi:hypothetical protein